MKFTNGFWLLREEYSAIYASEYFSHKIISEKGRQVLEVYAPSKKITGHADTLNLPMLTFRFSAPLEGAIRTEIVHFKGAAKRGPQFEVSLGDDSAQIEDTPSAVIFKSGNLSARISKAAGAFEISYIRKDESGETLLTNSSWRNAACFNRNDGKSFTAEQLELGVGEYIYGFGERFTPFVKNGQIIDMWNEDGGTASEIAYKNIPFYMSSKGYGVFVDSPADVSFEVGSEKVERVQFSVEGQSISYVVFGGSEPKETLTLYTAYTGRPALPPAWSYGLWLSTSFTTEYDEETVNSFIDGMKRRDLPLSVFHFDCCWMKDFEWTSFEWDENTFPNPPEMITHLHERGLKLCVWMNPYIAQNSALFDYAAENNYLLRRSDGSVFQTDLWQAGMGIVDFTNPVAAAWFKARLSVILDMGIDALKTDFGERIPVRDIAWYDGSDGVKMHNYYAYLYNKTIFELLEEMKGKGNAVLFARSAAAGGQKFPVHWGGDCTATYLSMAESIRAGLSLSLCGFGFWSHDIGGFENTATPDVYKRWIAFGMMSSHSRLHGSTSYRVPWNFDEESVDVLRFFTKLKLKYMPYIFAAGVEAHTQGIPCMRAMMLEFPDDRNCRTLDRQYMLGGKILVAPVLSEDGMAEYYLPDGRWISLISGEVREGGRWYEEKHDYFSLPLYIRENSMIISKDNAYKPDCDYGEDFCAEIYGIADGNTLTCEIHNPDGTVKATVTAKRNGGTVRVEAKGEVGAWRVQITNCGGDCYSFIAQENTVVIN
jgi:alpha-D-xyloside xylohydrolase